MMSRSGFMLLIPQIYWNRPLSVLGDPLDFLDSLIRLTQFFWSCITGLGSTLIMTSSPDGLKPNALRAHLVLQCFLQLSMMVPASLYNALRESILPRCVSHYD